MSVYGNYTDEYYLIYESDNEVKELMKQWKTSNQIHKRKLFKDNSLSEEEYDTLIEAYKIMRHSDDYKEKNGLWKDDLAKKITDRLGNLTKQTDWLICKSYASLFSNIDIENQKKVR